MENDTLIGRRFKTKDDRQRVQSKNPERHHILQYIFFGSTPTVTNKKNIAQNKNNRSAEKLKELMLQNYMIYLIKGFRKVCRNCKYLNSVIQNIRHRVLGTQIFNLSKATLFIWPVMCSGNICIKTKETNAVPVFLQNIISNFNVSYFLCAMKFTNLLKIVKVCISIKSLSSKLNILRFVKFWV